MRNLKKVMAILLAGAMCVGLLAGCGSKKEETAAPAESTPAAEESGETEGAGEERISIDKLRLVFAPSKEPDLILSVTEPLKHLVKETMADEGYDIGEVEISVGTSYDAAGEAVSAGTAEVGFIPGGTYVMYEDGVDVLMTSLDPGYPIDTDDVSEWNAIEPWARDPEDPTVLYRAFMIVGPSPKGQELAAKVEAGEELTWEDFDSANWSFMSASSPAGYIYPSLWLSEHFDGKTLLDLSHGIQSDSYGSAFARLASGQVDGLCGYAGVQIDYAEQWTTEYGREKSIWDETAVVAVSPTIYNDTISVSKNSPIVDEAFKDAFCNAIIAIGEIPEGHEALGVYGHIGYERTTSENYDSERAAQKMLREMNDK